MPDMTRSDDSITRRQENRPGLTRSLSRYDLLLAFMPTVFLVSIVVGNLLSIGVQTAFTGASLVGVIALVDALFLHPPEGAGRA